VPGSQRAKNPPLKKGKSNYGVGASRREHHEIAKKKKKKKKIPLWEVSLETMRRCG